MELLKMDRLHLIGFLLILAVALRTAPIVCGDGPGTTSPDKSCVYVKILLPETQSKIQVAVVEKWIADQLADREPSGVIAVTGWTRLPEQGETNGQVWDAVLGEKTMGCPVHSEAVERDSQGKIRVKLTGWAPIPVEQTGMLISDEIGCHQIAVVDGGAAYVAIIVVPFHPAHPIVGEK